MFVHETGHVVHRLVDDDVEAFLRRAVRRDFGGGEGFVGRHLFFLMAGGEGREGGGWRRRDDVREVRAEWGSRGDKDAERGFGRNELFV